MLVERAGHAVVQDLGRPGHGGIGVPINGALDQDAARTANILVGNLEDAPVLEITGSELVLVPDTDLLLSVTGAAEWVLVDGHAQPAWEPLAISAHARVVIPASARGYRSYVGVNGTIQAERALGSVAPDALLEVGTRLHAGDQVLLESRYHSHAAGHLGRVFRLGAGRPRFADPCTVRVTGGPDLARLRRGRASLEGPFRLLPQADHVGLRLEGAPIEQVTTAEILSRGVPVGAVEVVPAGGIIVLLRGRLVTAGYPVVAVVTTESLDTLAQTQPGNSLQMTFCEVSTAHAALRLRSEARAALADRVRAAFIAKGMASALHPNHSSTTVTP